MKEKIEKIKKNKTMKKQQFLNSIIQKIRLRKLMVQV